METKHLPRPSAAALLIIGFACAAVSNPNRDTLKPIGLPGEKLATEPEADADTEAVVGPEVGPPAPETANTESAKTADAPPPVQAPLEDETASSSTVALVGSQTVDVRRMMSRMWLRSSDTMRETLDHLVIERIALIEADRLGISVTPEQVELRLNEARQALEAQLAAQSAGTTVEDYIRNQLSVDPKFYDRQMRQETIAQLVAERVVRSWVLGSERADVRILEVAGQDELHAAQAELEMGDSFAEVAGRFHVDENAPGGVPLTLVRAENSALARVAFATEEGQVSGPIEDQGRFLLMLVEKRHPALEGAWDKIGRAVEQSLVTKRVGDFEFVQWRAHAISVHSVDLSPFFEMVGSPVGP